VLSLLKPRSYMSGGIDAGGDWSFQFERSNCFLCFALVSGHCWLSIEGVDEAVRLEVGDFVALPHGPAFRLASDLSVAPVDVRSIVTGPLNGRIVSWQGGGACLGLTAFFTFAAEHASILLGLLPPLVYIRSHADRAVMQWYLERMIAVLRNPQPGSVLLLLRDPHLRQTEDLCWLDRNETVLVSVDRARRRPQRRTDIDSELRLRNHAVQFHRGSVREEVGVSLAHLSGVHIRITNILRRPAQFEGNKCIEAGAKPSDEPPPRRFVNQRPGRGAAQPGDLFDIPKAEGGMAAFVEFHP